MGCTPSKSAVIYTQDKVCQDLDTCSTFVPSLKSFVSTPERPSPLLCVETSSGRQTFLSVPQRDFHGRSVSQSSYSESWSSAGISASGSSPCTDQLNMMPRSPTPDPHTDAEGCRNI